MILGVKWVAMGYNMAHVHGMWQRTQKCVPKLLLLVKYLCSYQVLSAHSITFSHFYTNVRPLTANILYVRAHCQRCCQFSCQFAQNSVNLTQLYLPWRTLGVCEDSALVRTCRIQINYRVTKLSIT
jgi:hypothetical protein